MCIRDRGKAVHGIFRKTGDQLERGQDEGAFPFADRIAHRLFGQGSVFIHLPGSLAPGDDTVAFCQCGVFRQPFLNLGGKVSRGFRAEIRAFAEFGDQCIADESGQTQSMAAEQFRPCHQRPVQHGLIRRALDQLIQCLSLIHISSPRDRTRSRMPSSA
eukprot:TRINITY_DN27333_c0_g1_i1.p2 TRINITY_DN27333_c0_g1~~TRINITY_DN27333_c0_g1_i1.p2  ORF type:complete len:159 (-),score=41.80 TRINITY_DN27333_c0_g1_i1:65-541(-)